MKKVLSLLTAFACMTACPMNAQTTSAADSLKIQRQLFPQEKVYVMTDREMYATGDTIWFRGWVVDGESLKEKQDSRFLYVELRDPAGLLKNRARVMVNENGVYEGYLPIDNTLESNCYTLDAYTYYMTGTNDNYFFKKPLDILSPTDILKGVTTQRLKDRGYPETYTDVNAGAKTNINMDVPANGTYAVSVTHFSMSPSNANAITSNLPSQADLFTEQSLRSNNGYLKPTFPYEQGNVISGTVMSDWSDKRKMKNIDVSAVFFDEEANVFKEVTDENGHFEIKLPSIAGDKDILIQAMSKHYPKTNIKFDEFILPSKIDAVPVLPNHFIKNSINTYDNDSKNWALTLKNNQSIILNNVDVKAKSLDYDYHKMTTKTKIFDNDSPYLNNWTQLCNAVGLSFFYPDSASQKYMYFRTSHLIDIYFDGKRAADDIHDYSDLNMYSPSLWIKAVEIFNEIESNILPERYGSWKYAVNFITKQGADFEALNMKLPNYNRVKFEGSQIAKSFNPTPSDLAGPVIYWNPTLKSDDSGNLNLALTLPDSPDTTYRITLEGISPNGELVHQEKFIRTK